MARSMTGPKALAVLCLLVFAAVSVSARYQPSHGRGNAPYGQNGNYTGFGLRNNYYQRLCPKAESLVTTAVKAAYAQDNSIIAGLIRLFFHDCFVRGCDGSVLLDGPNSEMQGAPNINSLRGFNVIDAAKAAIEQVCPGTVSCADIVSYAARDSIVLGGGVIPFGLWLGGRKDGSVSLASDTLTELPSPFLNYSALVQNFANKGLSPYEMITLSGAHTVGHAHCGIILSRLYNFQGTGLPDPAIDPTYLPTLQNLCPATAPGNIINMDMTTPTTIDVDYINDVLRGRGLFESDNALRTTSQGVSTLKLLDRNNVFSPAFSLAVLKMGTIQVLTGTAGNVRTNCSTIVGAVAGPSHW